LILNIIFGYSLTFVWRYFKNRNSKKTRTLADTLIIGVSEETTEIANIIMNNPEKGYKICAIINTEANSSAEKNQIVDTASIPTYHGLENIEKALDNHKPAIICLAPHLRQDNRATKELYKLLFSDCLITDATSLYEMITGKINLHTMTEAWFLENLKKNDNQIFERSKTILDYLAGIITGTVFIFLFIPISVAIKINSKGPIFYKQKRMGQDGKIFNLYKFRSMYSLGPDGGAEPNGAQFASKKDNRVTFVGKILRKTRLDELPQFWNLLKRDITLVGPRPERPEIVRELEQRMPFYSIRHIVKPGLIGWALIHQNYVDNYDSSLQKLQYDLYYIKNRSWLLDTIIFLRSINILIRFIGQ
jgi:lipopolysaccharide/colanic/teichoic acid biosynthesis glycosyltransferase